MRRFSRSSSRSARRERTIFPRFFIELNNFEFIFLADVDVHITDGTQIDLRSGQEGFNADIDRQSAFNFSDDCTFDEFFVFSCTRNIIPRTKHVSFVFRQNNHAVFVFNTVDVDFYNVTRLHAPLSVDHPEFVYRNKTFRFIIDIDQNVIGLYFYNRTRNNIAGFEIAFFDRSFENIFEFGRR